MLFLALLLPIVLTAAVDIADEAYLPENFSVKTFATGYGRTRGLHTLPNGDILLVKAESRNVRNDDSSIILFWDDDNDGVADGQQVLVAPGHDLSHGIEYIAPENNVRGPAGMGLLLASSDRTVYVWPYTHGDRTSSLGTGRALVVNMNAQAAGDDLGAYKGHWTRTLAVSPDDQRYLHISVGSRGNVDVDSYRSRIRRIDLTSDEESFDFREAEVFADGLRNEVGLAHDAQGILWGVENGADNLFRSDIGGNIHEDNPAEELNKFDGPVGTFYGYPYCWTEYNLPSYGLGRGTQWAWSSDSTGYGKSWEKDDQWCRTMSRGPELSMQGHSAPLGMTFYDYSLYDPEKCSGRGTFPPDADGDLFVGFHGSWNRDIPTGYKVVRIPFDEPGGSPSGEVFDLLRHAGDGAKWPSNVKPVDVQFDQCGRLLVSDDGTQSIFTISYDGESFPVIEDAVLTETNATMTEADEIVLEKNATTPSLDADDTNETEPSPEAEIIQAANTVLKDSSSAASSSRPYTATNICLLLATLLTAASTQMF